MEDVYLVSFQNKKYCYSAIKAVNKKDRAPLPDDATADIQAGEPGLFRYGDGGI